MNELVIPKDLKENYDTPLLSGQFYTEPYVRGLIERIARLTSALRGLLTDIEEYQSINLLGGEMNQSQVEARKALESR